MIGSYINEEEGITMIMQQLVDHNRDKLTLELKDISIFTYWGEIYTCETVKKLMMLRYKLHKQENPEKMTDVYFNRIKRFHLLTHT